MSRIPIRIPTPLRGFSDGEPTVSVEASTAGEALDALVELHPALRQHLFDDSGSLRSFVNVYKNDESIRFLDRESTALDDGDELSIVPSIAGGNDDTNSRLPW
jgi:adenylyltransferase/sulfurtransferase